MKNRITGYLSITLSIFIIAGCSSGSPTTPNKANLTNLAKIPATTADNENIKKINLSGRVLDSLSRKPIENASVLIYVIANDEVIKSIKSGNSPGKINTSATPLPGSSSTPSAGIPDTIAPPVSPVATLSPDPNTVNPVPLIEENEEKSIKPATKPINSKSKTSPLKAKTEIKNLPQPNPVIPTPTEPKPKENSGKELNENDIISALTSLKVNDIQEFNSSTGNDGKFWINKVPDTNIIVTVNAPNYKTVSIFNYDTSKVEDIVLQPLESKNYISEVIGNVISATNNPVENATVSASYVINESFSIPTNSNKMGAFQLDDVSIGERTFLATVKDETGKIISMGMTDFDVIKVKESVNKKNVPLKKENDKTKVKEISSPDKKLEKTEIKPVTENEEEIMKTEDDKTKVTETTSPDKKLEKTISSEKVKAETVEEISPKAKTENDPSRKKIEQSKDYPLLKVKAVTDYIELKGKITLPEETTLKAINVYTTFKKKGQAKEEIFLTDKHLDPTADNFELSLPQPESGYFYHLEFVAINKKGSYIYHHEFNQKKENKEMKISFISPLLLGKTDFIEKDGEKLPIFSWLPVENASFYKVSLDKIDKDNNITTIWEGITPFNTAIYPISTGSARLNYSNTYNWSVVAVKEGANPGNNDKLQFSKLNITSWSDLSHSPHMDFSPNGDDGTEEIQEIDKKKEG